MLEALIGQLEQVVQRPRAGYVQSFDGILRQVAALNDPTCIPLLLPFLEDDAEYDEMMFAIIHTIEAFDDDIYVQKILDSLPGLLAKAPRWAAVIHMRILNSPGALATYTGRVGNLSQGQRGSVRRVLELVRLENPRYDDRCSTLLAGLS
ncbi:MAG: hypothetical protein JXB13_19505 [Phycisphaerae bacterium]|nr:hypothetical protein [Phycisphaerae bacterium]